MICYIWQEKKHTLIEKIGGKDNENIDGSNRINKENNENTDRLDKTNNKDNKNTDGFENIKNNNDNTTRSSRIGKIYYFL